MTHAFFLPVLLLAGLLVLQISAQRANFPKDYSTHVLVHSFRVFELDLYYDFQNQRYRYDSYGVPMKQITNQLSSNLKKRMEDHSLEFASRSTSGEPLYMFYFFYGNNSLYSLFPNLSHGWDCFVQDLPKYARPPTLFNQTLLTDSVFIGTVDVGGEVCNHFQHDYIFFAMDYYQTLGKNLPKKLEISGDEFFFSNFDPSPQPDEVFDFPPNTSPCKRENGGLA